jgi:uncharacterized DUF497 family protein
MRYIWDDRKNAANIRKHGIAFARAIRIFEGPVLEEIDDRFDYGETRIQAIGHIDGTEVFVVYAESADEEHRIISARRATPEERQAYWREVARLAR